MQNNPHINNSEFSNIGKVSRAGSLTENKGDYFIFADKVYDIGKVITSHPGGY